VTSPIYIQATDTDPAVRAARALAGRGEGLCAELAAKVSLVTELTVPLMRRGQAWDGLLGLCERRIRAYLSAVDRVLYSVAAGASETRLLVRALRVLRGLSEVRIAELNRADGFDELAGAAHALLGLLDAARRLRRQVLIPALAALPGVDLPALAEDLDVLLAGGVLDAPALVDVRAIPHGQRHPRIFGRYARLAPGESFVLVNNHDPKPLRREFTATYPYQFSWEYLECGPSTWRVRIGRLAGPAGSSAADGHDDA